MMIMMIMMIMMNQVIIRPLLELKILDLKIHFCIDHCLDDELRVSGRNM